jgi:hypothetical protein
MVDKEIVETISKLVSVKQSYVLHVIEEWYEDTMIPKFEQIVGESGLYINLIDTVERTHDCIPEPTKPEGITDDEMVDFIVNNTLYRRPEVIEKIESGDISESVTDHYLIDNLEKIQNSLAQVLNQVFEDVISEIQRDQEYKEESTEVEELQINSDEKCQHKKDIFEELIHDIITDVIQDVKNIEEVSTEVLPVESDEGFPADSAESSAERLPSQCGRFRNCTQGTGT